ncbi:hypothetical protein [uncultured Planktomarina sp.]|uniref:hypothetical protein n=1 Tax=uncultured Planktomarina sp. TaxID=1538529 RepID=UPI003260C38F
MSFDETGARGAISYPSFFQRNVTLVRIGNLKTGQHSLRQAFFHIETVKISSQRESQSNINLLTKTAKHGTSFDAARVLRGELRLGKTVILNVLSMTTVRTARQIPKRRIDVLDRRRHLYGPAQ